MIDAGAVRVGGAVATKPATQVTESESIAVIATDVDRYVSRGAHKLLGALDAFAVDVTGRDCLDAGASTGGFTQVLLERGAARVLAVDVGYGQLAWSVRCDPRVVPIERTNVRSLTVDALPFRPSLVVADLSFISLTVVLPALVAVVDPGADADLLLMVKPQFEVGRDVIGDGVVRDPVRRRAAVRTVAEAAISAGLAVSAVVASPLPGPRGNVEYFLWLRSTTGKMGAPTTLTGDALAEAIDAAVREGPQ